MPELPEVEYARRTLRPWVVDQRIVSAQTAKSPMLKGRSAGAVSKFLRDQRVLDVERRGKHLLLPLSNGGGLYLHLGMTGKLITPDMQDDLGLHLKHIRLRLGVGDKTVLFKDPRMFGRVKVGEASALRAEFFGPLGPDPLEDELTPTILASRLSTKRPIKVALMDQTLIAGLGNIQVCEALWFARITPKVPAAKLRPKQVEGLCRAIFWSIDRTLIELEAQNGRYMSDGAPNPFKVYGRENGLCVSCKLACIKKIEQSSRATFYCPRCQS